MYSIMKQVLRICTCTWVTWYIHVYICTRVHVHVYMCMCCMYRYMHRYMHMCICMYKLLYCTCTCSSHQVTLPFHFPLPLSLALLPSLPLFPPTLLVPDISLPLVSPKKEDSEGDKASQEVEDEFSGVQVEDTNSFLAQLDSEVSHLVSHTHTQPHSCHFVHIWMRNAL